MSALTPSGAGPGLESRFLALWGELSEIGRDSSGGYTRAAWTPVDAQLRGWFRSAAAARAMQTEQDCNGNLWAWWGEPGPGAVATGSHLDSVPNGGAFDGPLGVVSGFLAVDLLRERGASPRRPVAVACMSDEEGARFGVACVGSRLMVGDLQPDAARSLADAAGTSLAQAMATAGADPGAIGADPARTSALSAFVELHVEQGRALADLSAPVGLATGIWPHGRWRLDFEGEPNHAGTTRCEDRRDPMLPLARTVLAARSRAEATGARATLARVAVRPNATNAIASRVQAWLDARAAGTGELEALVEGTVADARAASEAEGVSFAVERESFTQLVEMDRPLRERLGKALGGVPELPTAAGHDAGILARRLPTAMLFVRNVTGASHSPLEHATTQDCLAGVTALATVLAELTGA